MARVAHAMSATWHRNQIPAINQPRDLERNPRSELSDYSRSSQLPNACLGVAARDRDKASFCGRSASAVCRYAAIDAEVREAVVGKARTGGVHLHRGVGGMPCPLFCYAKPVA